MKKLIHQIFSKKQQKPPRASKEEINRLAVEGAKKAVNEYRQVFERLAEYDRT